MKYTIKEKFQVLIGAHPDTYPKKSTFQDLDKEGQRVANLKAAQEEVKRSKP